MPWEKTWANIPEEDKAKVYRVARLQIPFLARFRNDWATAAIARQYCSNLRADAYRRGELVVDPKWAYLKENAAKRKSGSRRKRAFIEAEAAEPARKKKKTKHDAAGAPHKSSKRRKRGGAAATSEGADDNDAASNNNGEEGGMA